MAWTLKPKVNKSSARSVARYTGEHSAYVPWKVKRSAVVHTIQVVSGSSSGQIGLIQQHVRVRRHSLHLQAQPTPSRPEASRPVCVCACVCVLVWFSAAFHLICFNNRRLKGGQRVWGNLFSLHTSQHSGSWFHRFLHLFLHV